MLFIRRLLEWRRRINLTLLSSLSSFPSTLGAWLRYRGAVNHVLGYAVFRSTGSGVAYFLSILLHHTDVEEDFESIIFITLTVPDEDSVILDMAVYRVMTV